MISEIQQLASELALLLDKFKPNPRRSGLRMDARNVAIREAMRRLRERRRRQGLKESGKPLLPENRKFINKKYL